MNEKRSKYDSSEVTRVANFRDVYFLGFGTIFSGALTLWNLGLQFGFWEFCFATLISAVGYLALSLCLAEMASILPFGGGAYGFARVTAGPYVGFLIGAFDAFTNSYYACTLVRSLCLFVINTMDVAVPEQYNPLYWLLCYAIVLCLLIPMGRYTFLFMSVLGMLVMVLAIVYVLSSASHMNFDQNVTAQITEPFLSGGVQKFMRLLPMSTWMFLGIDLIPLACDDTINAKVVVPKALVFVQYSLIVLNFVVIFSTCSQSPGFTGIAEALFPMNRGFQTAFNISDNMATVLSIPGIFVSLYGVVYCYGKQIHALSRSRLFPPLLARTTSSNVPYLSLIAGSVFGYLVLVTLYYTVHDEFDLYLTYFYFACLMGSFTVYLVSFVCFIIFRVKYSSLERHYVNYCGIPSAVIGIIIFAFVWTGCGFYQADGYFSMKAYTGFIGVCSLYYFLVARHQQTFSPEEQSILFIVYVIKSNSRKKTYRNWLSRKTHYALDHVLQHMPSSLLRVTSLTIGRRPSSNGSREHSRINSGSDTQSQRHKNRSRTGSEEAGNSSSVRPGASRGLDTVEVTVTAEAATIIHPLSAARSASRPGDLVLTDLPENLHYNNQDEKSTSGDGASAKMLSGADQTSAVDSRAVGYVPSSERMDKDYKQDIPTGDIDLLSSLVDQQVSSKPQHRSNSTEIPATNISDQQTQSSQSNKRRLLLRFRSPSSSTDAQPESSNKSNEESTKSTSRRLSASMQRLVSLRKSFNKIYPGEPPSGDN